jgi:tripartite-type tricarboxylate transporter receptor subunit TctC
MLAIGSPKRLAGYPDLPTVAEGGLPGFEAKSWFGLFATGGTPEPILAQLNGIANRTLQESKTVELLMKQGIVPRPLSPAEYKSFVAAESKKFAKIIEQARIKPEG